MACLSNIRYDKRFAGLVNYFPNYGPITAEEEIILGEDKHWVCPTSQQLVPNSVL